MILGAAILLAVIVLALFLLEEKPGPGSTRRLDENGDWQDWP